MSQQRNRARQGEKQQPWLFEMNFIRQMRWLELPCPFPISHLPFPFGTPYRQFSYLSYLATHKQTLKERIQGASVSKSN